jgi:hypothetical protein
MRASTFSDRAAKIHYTRTLKNPRGKETGGASRIAIGRSKRCRDGDADRRIKTIADHVHRRVV